MASYGLTAQADHVRSTIAEAKSLTVDRLKKVLKSENLPVSGIKSELQIRLIAHIEKCGAAGEYDKVSRIRNAIRGVTGTYINAYPSPYSTNTPTTSLSPQFPSPTPRPPPSSSMNAYSMQSYAQPSRMVFKRSPFYNVLRPLADTQELKAREQTRDTARINVSLDLHSVEQLTRDPNTRVMVFCAAESSDLRSMPVDISFPQHGELKCNQDDAKASLKGLKNKPGTTRPADITHLIRKRVNFPNTVELVYALTTKKYYLVVNLVQKRPVESLITDLRRGKYISKERVLREIQTKASDPDIVATSSTMSLKDPVQMTRIQTPCRSISCKHNECFDATVYLNLQEQAPTWTCPCCNKPAPWETLIFDQYFDDILRNVPDDVEQVNVEPDGRWFAGEAARPTTAGSNDDDSDNCDNGDDDEELVVISDSRRSATTELNRTPSFVQSPHIPGPPSTAPSSSNKRKHAETIDLTIDSDDDIPVRPPQPQPKRSSTSTTTYSYPPQYQSQQLNAPYRFQMPQPPPQPGEYNPDEYFMG